MIEEVSSIRIDSVWDLTKERIDEYKTINQYYQFNQCGCSVLYTINYLSVCMCRFSFIDDENILVEDYSHGEVQSIGSMLKTLFFETRAKFPYMNLFLLVDESGYGRRGETLRIDKVLDTLQETYYSVEFGRNPLFQYCNPLHILLRGMVRKTWAFDMNNKERMDMFRENERKKIEAHQKNKSSRSSVENPETLRTPLSLQLSHLENSTITRIPPTFDELIQSDSKQSTRTKVKSRKDTTYEENELNSYQEPISQKRTRSQKQTQKESQPENNKESIAQSKPKRGRPSQK